MSGRRARKNAVAAATEPPKAVMRCDKLPHAMNMGKERLVLELLSAWRDCARAVAAEQRRLFFETGRFQKNCLDKRLSGAIGAARLQMVRWQVVGMLGSWVSNRANEFKDTVRASTLPPETKRLLHGINRREAWFKREPVMIDGAVVSDVVRRLARSIMRAVMKRHSRPSMRRIGMVIDQRAISLAPARDASAFPLWARLSTLEKGRRVEIPLRSYDRFERRQGKRALTLQVSQTEGRLFFGVVTDVSEPFAASRAAYAPETSFVALDFGLKALFGTDLGDLLGRGFLDRLKHYDGLITTLVRHIQRSGLKPRQSKRCRALVGRLRGFVRAEINRVFNALVERLKPGMLVLERLRFQSPELSRRLNRIVQNCGRSVIAAKLKALEEEFGISSEEVNPAYTSQTCSNPACGYVDKSNRRDQARFECLWCGKTMHADVNAGRNIGRRRSAAPMMSVGRTKAAALGELTRRFVERRPRARSSAPMPGAKGQRGLPADPRWTNPYFRDWAAAARSAPEPERVSAKLPTAQSLVA